MFEAVAVPRTALYLFPDLEYIKLWTIADTDVYLTWALIGTVTAMYIRLVHSDDRFLQNISRLELFSTAPFKEQIPLAFWDTIHSGWPSSRWPSQKSAIEGGRTRA